MTPGAKARILRVLDAAWKGVNELCEELDEGIIDLMPDPKPGEDKAMIKDQLAELRTLCVHMKDARAALDRAKGAVP